MKKSKLRYRLLITTILFASCGVTESREKTSLGQSDQPNATIHPWLGVKPCDIPMTPIESICIRSKTFSVSGDFKKYASYRNRDSNDVSGPLPSARVSLYAWVAHPRQTRPDFFFSQLTETIDLGPAKLVAIHPTVELNQEASEATWIVVKAGRETQGPECSLQLSMPLSSVHMSNG